MTRTRTIPHASYLASNAFELLICALTLVAVLNYVLNPDELYESSVGRAVHPLDYGWLTLYGISSACVCFGLVARSPRLEVAGLVGYAAAVSVNLVALVALIGNQSILAICSYLALIAAALVRAHFVFSLSREP